MNSDKRIVDVVQPILRDDPRRLAWSTDLAKRFRDELGAVHLGVLAAHAVLGHVVLAETAGQYLGMMVSKPKLAADPRIFPIIAAAVPSDLQRLHVGESMLEALQKTHSLTDDRVFQAICRQDLPSNKFWAAAGFRPIAVRHSNSVRGKQCIVWRRRVGCSVTGIEDIIEGAKPRGGGGRFLTADNLHLRNWFDQTAVGIESALAESGARPLLHAWDAVKWLCPTEIDRPMSDQMTLFETGREPARPTPDDFRK